MGRQFFVTTLLPTLHFDKAIEMGFDEVIFFLKLNLSAKEMRQLDCLKTFYDIENACSYLSGRPMREEGSLPHDQLRMQIEEEELALPGAQRFFIQFPSQEARKKHASELIRFFLEEIPETYPTFIKRYFALEHTTKILTAYLRTKKQEFPDTQLGFTLSETKSWPEIFTPLEKCMSLSRACDLAEEVAKWKFHAIDTLCDRSEPFSLDYIFAYLLKLRIIENRQELLDPSHINILERIQQ